MTPGANTTTTTDPPIAFGNQVTGTNTDLTLSRAAAAGPSLASVSAPACVDDNGR